jgi:RNA polymerase sigma-70 factor, ECF subfamily
MVSDLPGRNAGGCVDFGNTIMDCRVVKLWPAAGASADLSVVLAAREGDRSAFGSLYSRYARMVHGILLARVPPGEVDDLVQDVFLHAMPRIGGLRDVTRFGGWLAAIARNRANDYHRQCKTTAAATLSLSEEETASSVTNSAQDAEAARILAVIRSLPEAYRETLILRLIEGMTGPEIAARTGLTPGSVRVNLHRGMQQLREKLGRTSADCGVFEVSPGPDRSTTARDPAVRKRDEP